MSEENEFNREEIDKNNYFNNKDVQNSFEYIKNLPKHSKELIDYYSQNPDLNSIYKTPELSCDNIKLLQKIFDEAPLLKTDLIVYRGLSIPTQNRISFDIDRLISTTTTYTIAKQFVSDFEGESEYERKFIMEITLKQGVKFLAISLPGTMFSAEHEILLPPGGSFTVTSDEQISINTVFDDVFSVFKVLKIYIEYSPKPSNINCVQSELDLDEQFEFIHKTLSKKSNQELLVFRITISDFLKGIKNFNNNLITNPEHLKLKSIVLNFIKSIHQLYKTSLIELTLKSDAFTKEMVYKGYMVGIFSIEVVVVKFLTDKKLYKYNKYVKKEITKLKTLVQLDRISGDLFKFVSSGN
jgi:hypothetical protein